MTDLSSPAVVAAPVKSTFASKTNITAALLGLFGILAAFGYLPEGFDTVGTVGAVTTAGALIVGLFRTFSTSVLRPAAKNAA